MEQQVPRLKAEFPALFDGTLGKVRGVEAKSELQEGAKPRLFKPYPVSLSVQQPIVKSRVAA